MKCLCHSIYLDEFQTTLKYSFISIPLHIRQCGTGKPQKTYLWILLIPYSIFIAVVSILILLSDFYIIPFLEICYLLLALIINAVVVAITIGTWKTVSDNIHVRGELILQTVVLWLTYIIYVVGYVFEITHDDDEEQYDQIFWFIYFTNNSVGSFLSIIIGTQYYRFKKWSTNWNDEARFARHSVRCLDLSEVGFQSVIAMADGLEAFMDYLANQKKQNYLIVK